MVYNSELSYTVYSYSLLFLKTIVVFVYYLTGIYHWKSSFSKVALDKLFRVNANSDNGHIVHTYVAPFVNACIKKTFDIDTFLNFNQVINTFIKIMFEQSGANAGLLDRL